MATDPSDLDVVPNPSVASARKVKLMCCFNGQIIRLPSDGLLLYVGGEIRHFTFRRDVSLAEISAKFYDVIGQPAAVRYQLPDADLDSLVSVSTPADLEKMMDEYDKLAQSSTAAMCVFLFTPSDVAATSPNYEPTPLDMEAAAEYEHEIERRKLMVNPLYTGSKSLDAADTSSKSLIWGGKFNDGSVCAVETMRVKADSDEDVLRDGKYNKHAQLSDDIVKLHAGTVSLSRACTGILRRLLEDQPNSDTNDLYEALQEDADLWSMLSAAEKNPHDNVRNMVSSLLLVDKSKGVLYVQINPTETNYSWHTSFGAGKGYDIAQEYLNSTKLPETTSIDVVIAKIIEAFEKAAENDEDCGGELRIFVAYNGQDWALERTQTLPVFKRKA